MFDRVGSIIDPNQHSGTVFGWIENPDGKIKIGQFATAKVILPAENNWVSIPTSSVVEDEAGSVIFVQTDFEKHHFVRRKVKIAIRGREEMYVISKPDADLLEQGFEGLSGDETVLSRGANTVAAEWKDLQKKNKHKPD
jgi:cobalt-zinc-cadmium efflux system membrane fusion protein